jgi:hypothetical protein
MSPQTIALVLSLPGRQDLIPLQETVIPGGPHYDSLLSAFRNTSIDEREGIKTTLALVEIEETTRQILGKITKSLDDP